MSVATLLLALSMLPAAEGDDLKALAGNWKVVAIFEEGAALSEKEIASELFAEGKISIDGPVISFLPPGAFEKKSVAFVVDKTTEPKQISLVGATKVGTKGIFMHSGDSLMVCVAGLGEKEAPKEFGTPKNSGRILMTFKRIKDDEKDVPVPHRPAPTAVEEKIPAADPLVAPYQVKAPVFSPIPPPVAPVDDGGKFKKMLVGTWGHQTDETVTYITLNADGSFSMSTTWKRSIKSVFKDDIRTSGEWKLDDGVIVAKVSTSTTKELRGQVYSYRVVRIGESDLVAVDQTGKSRREWKVR
ncbi:TIGR03067 domain-containing protein [Zavarzinella formosa]|uniref:TIGR03067 domain-containing protein n=1 Tax=Zavarzinella formosa TaxID=360055 RepID=UPI00030CB6FE|nr:TIGR03067 domain-containing protein [Zavarzinella formosa]